MKEEPIDKPDNKEPREFLGMDGEEWSTLALVLFVGIMVWIASNP